MPVTLRGLVPALAAALCGFLAAFVLTDPPGGRWSVHVSDRELDRWLSTQPTGIVLGAVVAAAVCVALQVYGSRRIAWVVAAVAVLPMLAVRGMVTGIAGVDGLVALHIVKCVAAGVLLGAAVAASLGHRIPEAGLVVGTLAGFLAAPAWAWTHASMSTSSLGEPAVWLLVVVAVVAVGAAVTAPTASRIQRITRSEATAAIALIAGLAILNRLLLAWIGHDDGRSRTHTWVIAGLSMVAVLVVTEIGARLLAQRVGQASAVLVLGATALAAAAMPVLVDLREPATRDVSGWTTVAVAVVALIVGVAVATRLPNPLFGIGALAVIPVLGIIVPSFGDHGAWLLVRLAILGVGAGWAVRSALPGSPAAAAVGLAIPFVSLVFHAAATVIVPRDAVVYDGSYEPLPGGGTESGGWTSYVIAPPSYDDRIAGIALTVAVLFCAWGIRSLRTPQPEDTGVVD